MWDEVLLHNITSLTRTFLLSFSFLFVSDWHALKVQFFSVDPHLCEPFPLPPTFKLAECCWVSLLLPYTYYIHLSLISTCCRRTDKALLAVLVLWHPLNVKTLSWAERTCARGAVSTTGRTTYENYSPSRGQLLAQTRCWPGTDGGIMGNVGKWSELDRTVMTWWKNWR